jgi:GPH family glycoside/pentoside/hexuronide:cation symporter
MYALTNQFAKGKKVIISETGWPSKGQKVLGANPSAENAMKYFIHTQQWARDHNIEMFYFSSFDESWKLHHEGEVGTQWGLWDINEKQKFG